MTRTLPAAVLWDMDGTLVDTEPYWMAAETPLVESFGGSWSHEQSLAMVGLGLDDAAVILQEAGVDMEVAAIVGHLVDAVMLQIRTMGIPFRPGARELLADLHEAGVKNALVTMSLRNLADTVTEVMGAPGFDASVAGDEVTRPKPYPDPYLHAADLLGVDIRDCVAIEDSPNGLRSAISAGTVAIGVPLMVPLAGVGAQAELPTLAGVRAADIADIFSAHRSRNGGAA